nr:hypothetical protein [Tanacetum cinerariifolium]
MILEIKEYNFSVVVDVVNLLMLFSVLVIAIELRNDMWLSVEMNDHSYSLSLELTKSTRQKILPHLVSSSGITAWREALIKRRITFKLSRRRNWPSPAIESTSGDVRNKNTSDTKTEATPSTISPKPFIKFVKATDSPKENKTDKGETVKKHAVNCKWEKKGTSRPQNITLKSFTPRPAIHRSYRSSMRPTRPNMNAAP